MAKMTFKQIQEFFKLVSRKICLLIVMKIQKCQLLGTNSSAIC